MGKRKKIKESKSDRQERIEILGGFGTKKTQVVRNKKKYSRKEKGTKAMVPFDFYKLFMRYIHE